MANKRIFCKEHDSKEVVIKIGVEQPPFGLKEVFPTEAVWNDIVYGTHTFFTFSLRNSLVVIGAISTNI